MDYFRRKQISAMLLFFALLLPISMVAMEQNNGVFSFKLQDVTVKDIFKYIEKNSEYMGHRTKRILRIERKEYQTY